MNSMQKALVLLDMARDHLQDTARSFDDTGGSGHDFTDMIDTLDGVVLALEQYSNWPKW